MVITLPRSFGAGLLRKRARPAPRRRKDDFRLDQIESESRAAFDANDTQWLIRLYDELEAMPQSDRVSDLQRLVLELSEQLGVLIGYPE